MKAVIQNNQTQKGVLTTEDVNSLVQAQIIPKGTPVPQIKIFAQICNERGISPFSKEVYLVGYGGNYSVIVGINGFRKIAAETGEYAGCDDVKFNVQSNGDYQTAASLASKKQLPVTATITVHRIIKGHKVSFTHTAVFTEFSTGRQKWGSMPFQMIAKVAEAFALRKGFSDRLTGLNISEEKGAFTNETIDAKATVIENVFTKELFEKTKSGIIAMINKGSNIEQIKTRILKKYASITPETLTLLNRL